MNINLRLNFYRNRVDCSAYIIETRRVTMTRQVGDSVAKPSSINALCSACTSRRSPMKPCKSTMSGASGEFPGDDVDTSRLGSVGFSMEAVALSTRRRARFHGCRTDRERHSVPRACLPDWLG